MKKKLESGSRKSLPCQQLDSNPGVLSLQSALVVAGGEIGDMTYTEAVEVLRVGERPDALQLV